VFELLISTRNAHKLAEIRDILGAAARCHGLDEFPGAPEVVEDAPTFAGNATKKAVALADWLTGQTQRAMQTQISFVLADDSGLEVDALNGAPGVYSARFAALDTGKEANSTAEENNAKLLRLLGGVPIEKRTARFRCVMALTPRPGAQIQNASPVCAANEAELATELFEGVCEGHLELAPRGRGGFGYDPLFVPNGYSETFGELGEETKNQLSHRAMALQKLRSRLGLP